MNNLNASFFRTENLLTQEEMAGLIDPAIFREITFTDRHPYFGAYVIAHEGYATSSDAYIYKYVRKAIKKIYTVLKLGTDIFFRHNQRNAEPDATREVIGKVVGKTEIESESGDLITVAIIYLKPNYRNEQIDIASIECSIIIDENQVVQDIVSIDGIALSNSEIDTPGFSNAVLIQQLSYFANQNQRSDNIMTLDEIKKYLEENQVLPTQLFTIESILLDNMVDGRVKKMLQEKHEHARRLENKIGELMKEHENEKSLIVQELKSYQNKIWGVRAGEILKSKLDELTDPDAVKDMLKTRVLDQVTKNIQEFNTEEDLKNKIDEIYKAEYEIIDQIKSALIPPNNKQVPPKSFPKSAPPAPPAPDTRSDEEKAVDELLAV